MLLKCGVGEDSWESLACKQIKPVNPKEINPEYSSEGLMLKLKRQYFGYLKAGGEGDDRGWMVEWRHWLNGHEFEPGLVVGDGLGGLVCCSPWGRKESDMTEWLNWTELNWTTRWCLCLNFSYSSQDYKHLRNKSCVSVIFPKLTCIEKLACY